MWIVMGRGYALDFLTRIAVGGGCTLDFRDKGKIEGAAPGAST